MTATYDADLQLFIDGAWRSGEGRDERPVFNPATAGTIAGLPVATTADLDEALAAAERGWPVWRAKTPDERAALIHRTRSAWLQLRRYEIFDGNLPAEEEEDIPPPPADPATETSGETPAISEEAPSPSALPVADTAKAPSRPATEAPAGAPRPD